MLVPFTVVAPALPALAAIIGAATGAWFARRNRSPPDPGTRSPPPADTPLHTTHPDAALPHLMRFDPRPKE